jgi:hypothetical protein
MATDGQIQVNYGRLKLCRQLYAYVTATSIPVWDLENFDRLIFVAQSVHAKLMHVTHLKANCYEHH